jgi:hypothetical protein
MNKPIYQLFVGNNNIASNLAWKALSETERKALMDQDQASQKTAGVKMIVGCDSAWADEMHPWWGVLRFPDLQARIDHTHRMQKAGWLEITDAFTLLGTTETEPEAVTIPNPIYKLWIIKNNPATALTRPQAKGLDPLIWEKHAALYKEYGSQQVLFCESTWCNEAYSGFGVDAFPNVEANMKIMQVLNDLGFAGYFDSVTYLGIPGM